MDQNTKDIALAIVGLVGSLATGYLAYLAAKRDGNKDVNKTGKPEP